jgi:aspartate-semialdehyde dehydrogenase
MVVRGMESEFGNTISSRARLRIPTDSIWVGGNQLLKGAALNAVQIAEELLK